MHPNVHDYFRNFSIEFEGLLPHMYLDRKNLVTIGIGNLIEDRSPTSPDPAAPAVTLPFKRKVDSAPASELEIRADFASVKKHPGLKADAYAPFTLLELTPDDIDQFFFNKLGQNEVELRKLNEFSSLDLWPADAQLGLFSMDWAMGPAFAQGEKFPDFRAACKNADFLTAAHESHMLEVDNPGLIQRNWANEILFTFAARVLKHGLPIEDRIFPRILTAGGDILDLDIPLSDAKWPILKMGNSGTAVEVLQTLLFGAASTNVTGTFDNTTDDEVKTLQGSHTDRAGNPLTVDGIVGRNTWRALVLG